MPENLYDTDTSSKPGKVFSVKGMFHSIEALDEDRQAALFEVRHEGLIKLVLPLKDERNSAKAVQAMAEGTCHEVLVIRQNGKDGIQGEILEICA
jgi:hypothetical protein